jgi:hypothetical protein
MLVWHRELRPVARTYEACEMNAIRDWFKSLRLAILAGRATFDMEQYRARKRRNRSAT